MSRTGLIVQARTHSQRLPNKVLLPFFGQQSILDLLLERLAHHAVALPVCLATTTSGVDDRIVEVGARHGVPVHRGPEQDVLVRFIEAAEAFGFDALVRVCADNPFLDAALLQALLEHARQRCPEYLSHQVAGTPSILTHYGFFCEYVTTDALRRVDSLAPASPYREHVTQFIYTHPQEFDVAFIPAPDALRDHPDVRLTVDTERDFETAGQLYAQLMERGMAVNYQNLLALLDEQPALREQMRERIRQYAK